MPAIISAERPDTQDAMELIAELQSHLTSRYLPQSRHGYSVEKLIQQRVAFFVIRQDSIPAGCGGIQFFGEYGELKRMFVRPQFRGLGLGKLMLNHLASYALEHGVEVLRLETGIYQTEAIGLYKSFGFKRIPPFGPYKEDPVSLCFEKRLIPNPRSGEA